MILERCLIVLLITSLNISFYATIVFAMIMRIYYVYEEVRLIPRQPSPIQAQAS